MTPSRYHLRNACRLHAWRQSIKAGIPLGLCGMHRLETLAEKMRPAYERPGRTSYELVVRRGPMRFCAIYDTRLECLITVYPVNLARHRPPHTMKEAA